MITLHVKIESLLLALEERLPPPKSSLHHAITLIYDPDPRLGLRLARPSGWHSLVFDEGDLDKPIIELIDNILQVLAIMENPGVPV